MSNDAMIIDDNNVVGAGLVPAHAVVPAHDVVLSDDGSIVGASDHDVVPVNTRATTRVAPTLGHVIGTYFSLPGLSPLPITHHSLQSSARKAQSEDSGQPAHTGIGRQCSFPW